MTAAIYLFKLPHLVIFTGSDLCAVILQIRVVRRVKTAARKFCLKSKQGLLQEFYWRCFRNVLFVTWHFRER